MNEFELIARFFATQSTLRRDTVVGIGDDAAVLSLPPDAQLVVSTDTLVAGVHFPVQTDPFSIGWKSLAVNLSDLAAMGAEPRWFTLNLTLPQVDSDWLRDFAAGVFALAEPYGVQLVGGDTTRGPLTITVTVHGSVPTGTALLRSGAQAGDRIYVTGVLGDAALGLRAANGESSVEDEFRGRVLERLNRPVPRIAEGQALRGVASACIDISDGLAADLGHILERGHVGASIALARLPVSAAYRAALANLGWSPALSHGDDYELCFTVPAAKVAVVESLATPAGMTAIGVIEHEAGLRVQAPDGQPYPITNGGYDHFR